MSRKYLSKSKPGEVKAMIGQGLNVTLEDKGGEETHISGPDSERAYDILKAKGDDVFELGSSSINEKKNSAFDDAKTYVEKAAKEGTAREAIKKHIIDNYGLTADEADELIIIYLKETKNSAADELKELEDDIKVTKRQIEEAHAKGDKAHVVELQDSLVSLERRYDGLKSKENKNMIDIKVGDKMDMETTATVSVGQKKQYDDGEGNNWWIKVEKITARGYSGTIVGKVGGNVNSDIPTDVERRNKGKDLYGSEKKNSNDVIKGKIVAMRKDGMSKEDIVKSLIDTYGISEELAKKTVDESAGNENKNSSDKEINAIINQHETNLEKGQDLYGSKKNETTEVEQYESMIKDLAGEGWATEEIVSRVSKKYPDAIKEEIIKIVNKYK